MKKSKTTEKLKIEHRVWAKIGDTKRHGYMWKNIYEHYIAIGILRLHLFLSFIWSILLLFIFYFFCFPICELKLFLLWMKNSLQTIPLAVWRLVIFFFSLSLYFFDVHQQRDAGDPRSFVADLFSYTEINNSELLHIKHKLVQWFDTIQSLTLRQMKRMNDLSNSNAVDFNSCHKTNYGVMKSDEFESNLFVQKPTQTKCLLLAKTKITRKQTTFIHQ